MNANTQPKQILAVKSVGAVQFINVEDLMWIRGAANYAELHCTDQTLLHRETLTNLESQLDPQRFVRVHRSALVNINCIRTLSSELGRYSVLKMTNGDEIKVSHSRKAALFAQLGLKSA